MKITFLPKTRPGRWSAWLCAGALTVLLLYNLLPDALNFIPDAIKFALVILSLAAFIAAFVLGLTAVLRQKERAVIVFLSTLIGITVIVLLVIRMFHLQP